MASVRPPQPPREQTCPVCGSKLALGTLYCESCGTDLSRSGALFSTDVKPITSYRRRRRAVPRPLRYALLGVAVIVVLMALGSVPAVSARVPVLGALGQTVQRSVDWGRALLGGAPAVEAQAEALSLLVVRSDPGGAQVYLDDQYLGTTPMSADVPPGTHEVRISGTGYPPITKTIELREGPLVVSVTLGLMEEPGAPAQSFYPTDRPAPPVQTARPPLPAPPQSQTRTPLAVGARAPGFALKDRLGVIFKLESFRGRTVAMLFVWTLDDAAEQAIRELDARVRRASPHAAGVVIVMRPDRAGVRNLLATSNVHLPVLFGTTEVGRSYQVPTGVNVLYLVSERGVIERRQIGTIKPPALR